MVFLFLVGFLNGAAVVPLQDISQEELANKDLSEAAEKVEEADEEKANPLLQFPYITSECF